MLVVSHAEAFTMSTSMKDENGEGEKREMQSMGARQRGTGCRVCIREKKREREDRRVKGG